MSAILLVAGCLAIISTLVLVNVDQVEQNEYGLVFNWVTKSIGKEVFHGGTHFIGAWNTFVTFPATVQTIEFSERLGRNAGPLHTRTKEGLALHLSISFQYLLTPSELPELYALTNAQYDQLYIRIARDQLLEAAAEYEGPQYWLERQKIGHHMRKLVDGAMKTSHASLWGLQLLIIDLPENFENSIIRTQVEKQNIMTKDNEQVSAGIQADTEVMTADYNRQVTIVQSGANANFTLDTQLAKAEAQKRRIAAEADMMKYVRDKLHLSATGAVAYQQLDAYSRLQNANFLANVVGATPVLGVGAARDAPSGLIQEQKSKATGDAMHSHLDSGHISTKSFLAVHK